MWQALGELPTGWNASVHKFFYPRGSRLVHHQIVTIAVPIFTETKASGEILSKMKKLDNKDLMEIYTGYNKNKSIADIVNDEIDLFELLFTDKKYKDFQDVMMNLERYWNLER